MGNEPDRWITWYKKRWETACGKNRILALDGGGVLWLELSVDARVLEHALGQ